MQTESMTIHTRREHTFGSFLFSLFVGLAMGFFTCVLAFCAGAMYARMQMSNIYLQQTHETLLRVLQKENQADQVLKELPQSRQSAEGGDAAEMSSL